MTGVSVQQAEDPIIKGIYDRLAENEFEPLVNTFITFGHLTLLVRQEWINLKNALIDTDNNHKTIFLRGVSGRGKSSFVYYLMYCILIAAKGSKKRKAEQENEPDEEPDVVGYVRNEGFAEVKFLLRVSGIKNVDSIPISVYYYIADIKGDVNSTNLAQRLTMAVASDDVGKTEFRKRVKENHGKTYAMPSPTREQMHSIFKEALSTVEIDFRLDVVGCNPRELGTVSDETYKNNEDFDKLVRDTCAEILGCEETDTNPSHFKWVMGVVMQSIETAIVGENKITMTSLFRDDIQVDNKLISVFTSTFMCFLAGRIRDKFAANTTSVLTNLFGRSGIGNCHEYDAHNFFCELTTANHPCWKSVDNKWVELPLGGGRRQKVIFRNINSISSALMNSATHERPYLLPSIQNLALIDSIIPADINMLLQMTVSEKHRGATNRMADIYIELGNPEIVRMVFVVPEDVFAKFTFPTDMPEYVEMYVTVAKIMTLADAKKFRRI